MSIKTVGIIGAGAVGSYVIWGLSKVEDIKLGVIAKGERNQKLKADGCKINGNVYRPEVWTPDEAKGVDLLIVSLKYGALPAALDDIKAATGGSWMVKGDLIKAGEFDKIKDMTAEAVALVKEIRSK